MLGEEVSERFMPSISGVDIEGPKTRPLASSNADVGVGIFSPAGACHVEIAVGLMEASRFRDRLLRAWGERENVIASDRQPEALGGKVCHGRLPRMRAKISGVMTIKGSDLSGTRTTMSTPCIHFWIEKDRRALHSI